MMDPHLVSLLSEIAAEGQSHDAAEPEHARRRLNLEPETARTIATLLRMSSSAHVLEIGTSNGYSTLWLAWAVAPFDGKVVSIERDPQKQAMAAANLKRAGLDQVVDLRLGDGTEIVEEIDGMFDAVFFDADRWSAPRQLELLRPKLWPCALVLADNALSHPEEIRGYLELIESLAAPLHQVLPIGKGLSVAVL